MCGIAGLWQSGPVGAVDLGSLAKRMADTMIHRGPDASGVWVDPNHRCALSHRRLSIIDTSNAGAQPFSSRDQRWHITFNGEIYNFMEVKELLEQRGHVFMSRSDTEVLIEAIAEWGASAVEHLDGMFAFAAFNTQSGQLILARDPFGEKPFYLTKLESGVLAFASELRALEDLPGFDSRISMDALAEYLCFQYVGAPRTIYESVEKLKPGHIMVLSPGREPVRRQYFRFDPGREVMDRPFADAADELEAILLRSIERRLVADVPLGAFLSGGVDSSLVCALVTQKLKIPLNTYSMGFNDAPESEHVVARAFAEHIGARHHESIISPDVGRFLDIAGRVLDEPNADTSCFPTYLLSEFARRHVTVAVSGDGGDEMFGGYGRYTATLLEKDLRGLGELPLWRPGSAYYGPRILISREDDVEALLGDFPPGCQRHLHELRSDLQSPDDLLAAMRRSDVDNYLPGAVLAKVDRMSMQHSLEVRTPFLNVELARFAEKLPAHFCCGRGFSKRILREIAGRYLPKSLVNLPKQGFGLPMADWTRDSLLPRARTMLRGDGVLHGLLGASLERAIERQETSDGFNAYRLWSIVVLEAWLREHNVTLPDLSKKLRPSNAAPADQDIYWAVECAEKVFVVARGARETAVHAGFESLNGRLQFEYLKLANQPRARKTRPAPVQIELRASRSLASVPEISDSTLFFVEADSALRIGSAECARLRAMRVHRILMPHRFDEDDIEDLTFQYPDSARKVLNTIRLWRHRAGSYAQRHRMKRLFATHVLTPQSQHMAFGEDIGHIVGPPERELSDRYAIFQGMTQCPPLRVDFADVDERGDGRYWIYDKMIGLSPTKASRGSGDFFWSVPMTRHTAPYLDISPTGLLPQSGAETKQLSFLAMLEQIVAAAPVVKHPRPLRQGDRIALLTHALPPGGAERQWVYLALALTRMGYRVTFIVLHALQGENAHYVPYLRTNGVEILQSCDLAWSGTATGTLSTYPLEAETLISRANLAKVINAIRLAAPRAVFTQLDYPNIVTAIASLFCKVEKVILSFRNHNPSHFEYIYKDWYQSAYRVLSTSPRVVLTGNHVGANDDYADWIGIPRSRVVTIPNALDNEIFPVASPDEIGRLRTTFGLSQSTPVILGVFRLSDEKRPLLFIDIVREIAEANESVHVILVGVGPLQERVQEAVRQSPAASRIHLAGKRDDVNVLMAVASLLLHTATKEGMPNVVMEAVASGLPVVATNAGAIQSLVVDGENGFLHEENDNKGLRESCVRLIDDSNAATRMREAALRHAERKFLPANMACQYLDAASYQFEQPHLSIS